MGISLNNVLQTRYYLINGINFCNKNFLIRIIENNIKVLLIIDIK